MEAYKKPKNRKDFVLNFSDNMRKVLKLINKAKIKHKNPYEHEVAELVDDFKYDYTKFLTRLNFF